jgi:hypothetical protein
VAISRRHFLTSAVVVGATAAVASGPAHRSGDVASAAPERREWLLDAAEFRVGQSDGLEVSADVLRLRDGIREGTWLSPPHDFGGPFDHAGLLWDAVESSPDAIRFALRVGADASAWSPWIELPTSPHARPVGREGLTRAGDLVAVAGRFVQVRIELRRKVPADPSPSVRHALLTALEPSGGPSTAEAARTAGPMRSAGPFTSPPIISRAAWGCPEPSASPSWPPEYAGVTKLFVHHTVTAPNPDAAATVRAIWSYHAITLGWGDVGYNFLVDAAGNLYEGRFGGDNVVAGHALCFNPGSVGIGLLGDFRTASVPPAMRAGLERLLAWLCAVRGIHPQRTGYLAGRLLNNICAHRDGNGTCAINTECPGDALYQLLPAVRDATWNALPAYSTFWQGHDTPWQMAGGSTYSVRLTVSNRGRLTWASTGANPFHVGYRWFRPNGSWYAQSPQESIRAPLPNAVEMGAAVSLTARVVAPRESGTFNLHWDLVQEGVTWFEDRGAVALAVPVTVQTSLQRRLWLPAARRGP